VHTRLLLARFWPQSRYTRPTMCRTAKLVFCLFLVVPICLVERKTVSLDGIWDVADSVSATAIPTEFGHKGPVPGLVHSSIPSFPDVDQFDSREHIINLVRRGDLPHTAIVNNAGVPHQNRNYFWYRTSFTPGVTKAVAILKINKAQFGTAVWINGKLVGEHLPCFSAAYLNITSAMRWSGPNELIIRIGAHPGVLPANVSAGTDFEKLHWTPGIYDDVSLLLSDNPVVETIQVAPYISPISGIVVQTKLHNYGSAGVFELKDTVHPWKENGTVVQKSLTVSLHAGEEKTITEKIDMAGARLWSPEEPNLYVLETSSGGASLLFSRVGAGWGPRWIDSSADGVRANGVPNGIEQRQEFC
jgi:beta-galactosidase